MKTTPNAVVRVKDVARVELAAQDYNSISYLSRDPAVALAVFQRPGSNALATAEGIKAINYFATQVKADGLTIYVGSANEIDPVRSRSSVAQYDLKKINFIGGNVRTPLVTVPGATLRAAASWPVRAG